MNGPVFNDILGLIQVNDPEGSMPGKKKKLWYSLTHLGTLVVHLCWSFSSLVLSAIYQSTSGFTNKRLQYILYTASNHCIAHQFMTIMENNQVWGVSELRQVRWRQQRELGCSVQLTNPSCIQHVTFMPRLRLSHFKPCYLQPYRIQLSSGSHVNKKLPYMQFGAGSKCIYSCCKMSQQ